MRPFDLTDPPVWSPAGEVAAQPDRGGLVAILLCTRNGAEYLPEQLASLRAQTHTDWRLVASDDGSADETRALLAQYRSSLPAPDRVEIRNGPRRGAAANFLSLATDPTIEAEYFAYCDQDDVWHSDKLERALRWLQRVPPHIPAVYGSRTRAVASDGRPLRVSPLFRKPPAFRNALVQNLAGGNTMVLNKAARALLVDAGPREVVAHDWWTYLLVSGAGGTMLYDPAVSLDYRQHADNQIGANQGFAASSRRLRFLFQGQFARWTDINVAALRGCAHLLSHENKGVLELFCAMRTATLSSRIKLWRKVRPFRQTTFGQMALMLALLISRI